MLISGSNFEELPPDVNLSSGLKRVKRYSPNTPKFFVIRKVTPAPALNPSDLSLSESPANSASVKKIAGPAVT